MAQEADLQNTICEYLTKKKYFFWRQNVAPTVQRSKDGSMFFRKMGKYALKGIPDIIIIGDGGFAIFLEIKSPKGVQSEDQKKFQQRCYEVGAEYYLIKNIDEVLKIL